MQPQSVDVGESETRYRFRYKNIEGVEESVAEATGTLLSIDTDGFVVFRTDNDERVLIRKDLILSMQEVR
jgi:hypothetical protein